MKKMYPVILPLLILLSCKKLDSSLPTNKPVIPPQSFRLEGITNLASLETGQGVYRDRQVTYQVYRNQAIIGGDVIVPLSQVKPIGSQDVATESVATATASEHWPNNIVNYRLNEALTNDELTMINAAIAHWQANTNIRFSLTSSIFGVLEFTNTDPAETGGDNMYSTSIGRSGLRQYINLATWATTGNVIHEIGHAVGLWHEHQRADRNNFIIVDMANIRTEFQSNFTQATNSFESFGGLDFGSIMMYSSFTGFEVNQANPSITTLNGFIFFAQRTALSQMDISGNILAIYPKRIAGMSTNEEGTGTAIGYINGNNIPDLVLMSNHDPDNANYFRYKIAFDLDNMGNSTNVQTSYVSIEGVGHHQDGAGCTLADINNNGIPDLILMGDDDPAGPNQFRYKIAFDLNVNGVPQSISPFKAVEATGDYSEGAGVAIAQIDNNPLPDLILMGNDAPAGANQFRYKVAFNLDANGNYASVSPLYSTGGVGDLQESADVAVGDVNGNGIPDLIFLGDDAPGGRNEFRYIVAFDLNTSGAFTSVGPMQRILGLGDVSQGASATLFDIDNNGVLDLLLSTSNTASLLGTHQFRYIVGFNLNAQGVTQNWR